MALDTEDIVDLVLSSIFFALYLVGVPLFLVRRNKEPIRSRGWALGVLQMSAIGIDMILRLLGFTYLPCLLLYIRGMTILTVWVYPYFLRCFALWYFFSLQQTLLSLYSPLARSSSTERLSKGQIPTVDPNNLPPPEQGEEGEGEGEGEGKSGGRERNPSVAYSILDTFKGRLLRGIQRRPWLISTRFQLLACLVLFLISLVLALGTHFPFETEGNCYPFLPTLAINVLQSVGALLLLFLFCYLLWDATDAYMIKLELFLASILMLPLFILWAVAFVFDWKGVVFPGLWIDLAQVMSLISIYIPLVGSYLLNQQKTELETEREGEEKTDQRKRADEEFLFALEGDIPKKHFEQFVTECWAIENLIFHRRVTEYKLLPPQKLQQEAKRIFDECIAVNSLYQINIDVELLEKIAEEIKSEKVSSTTFDEAHKHCLNLLRYSVFRLWKEKHSYKALLKNYGVSELLELKNLTTKSIKKARKKLEEIEMN